MAKLAFQILSDSARAAQLPVEIRRENLSLERSVFSTDTVEIEPGRYHIFTQLPEGIEIHKDVIVGDQPDVQRLDIPSNEPSGDVADVSAEVITGNFLKDERLQSSIPVRIEDAGITVDGGKAQQYLKLSNNLVIALPVSRQGQVKVSQFEWRIHKQICCFDIGKLTR
jgi:hypothetical protein